MRDSACPRPLQFRRNPSSRPSLRADSQDFAVQVAADNLGELNYDEIILLLKKAMGANYDRQSSGY